MIEPMCSPIITSPYGNRIDPFDTNKMQFHDGIDIVPCYDDPNIYAIANGKITYDMDDYNPALKYFKGHTGGNMIIICHSIDDVSYYVRYLHLEANFYNKGDYVTEGAIIGKYGDYGISKGKHLHIDFYTMSWEKIDPTPLFNAHGLLL